MSNFFCVYITSRYFHCRMFKIIYWLFSHRMVLMLPFIATETSYFSFYEIFTHSWFCWVTCSHEQYRQMPCFFFSEIFKNFSVERKWCSSFVHDAVSRKKQIQRWRRLGWRWEWGWKRRGIRRAKAEVQTKDSRAEKATIGDTQKEPSPPNSCSS